MVTNNSLPEQPKMTFTTKKPKYTYGVRLFLCAHCNAKQHMKMDDKVGSVIRCTRCWEQNVIVANTEVETDLYDCRTKKYASKG